MDKKLAKYIERYDVIQECESYDIKPNGGMIVLLNQGNNCDVIIADISYAIANMQVTLINVYEHCIAIKSHDQLNLIAARFKGAGASFFYEELMGELMQNPKVPIFIKESILENELDNYFKSRLTASKLPFNIMKIIDLLDSQGSNYSIDEILAIANIPRKVFDKMFNLRTGLTFKTYASIKEHAIEVI